MVYRHPFPGPGLGVRILGEVTQPEAQPIRLRIADHIFIEELRKLPAGTTRPRQAFAVFLPVKSRRCRPAMAAATTPVIAIRAVETIDFMTARWARLPYELLDEGSACESSTKIEAACRAWSTTSPASRLRPSSGSETAPFRFNRHAR